MSTESGKGRRERGGEERESRGQARRLPLPSNPAWFESLEVGRDGGELWARGIRPGQAAGGEREQEELQGDERRAESGEDIGTRGWASNLPRRILCPHHGCQLSSVLCQPCDSPSACCRSRALGRPRFRGKQTLRSTTQQRFLSALAMRLRAIVALF